MNVYKHIYSNPEILGGKPIIKGTRISVSLILEWLASGASIQDIIAQHPLLTTENISEAILFQKNKMSIDRINFLGSIDFKEDPIKMQRRMRGH